MYIYSQATERVSVPGPGHGLKPDPAPFDEKKDAELAACSAPHNILESIPTTPRGRLAVLKLPQLACDLTNSLRNIDVDGDTLNMGNQLIYASVIANI